MLFFLIAGCDNKIGNREVGNNCKTFLNGKIGSPKSSLFAITDYSEVKDALSSWQNATEPAFGKAGSGMRFYYRFSQNEERDLFIEFMIDNINFDDAMIQFYGVDGLVLDANISNYVLNLEKKKINKIKIRIEKYIKNSGSIALASCQNSKLGVRLILFPGEYEIKKQ